MGCMPGRTFVTSGETVFVTNQYPAYVLTVIRILAHGALVMFEEFAHGKLGEPRGPGVSWGGFSGCTQACNDRLPATLPKPWL